MGFVDDDQVPPAAEEAIAGVIDALSPGQPAIIMGHDWGAPIVWHTAVLHPSKVRAVAGLSVPYFDRSPAPLNQIFKMMYTDQGKFFYMAYFQNEGVAEAEFEADVRSSLRRLYFASSANSDGRWGNLNKPADEPMLKGLDDPKQFPAWLSDADIDYYVSEFERSGFRGPINRYRNFERDWVMMGGVEDRRIHQPSLFVAGAQDMVLKMFGDGDIAAMTERMKEMMPNLQNVHLIPNCGHWTQQETPAETTRILVDWLKTL